MLMLALLAQATAAPEGADRLSVAPRACPAGPSADGEVVVCGRPNDQRLRPLPALPETKHVDPATFRLAGGTVNLHAIHTALPGAEEQGVAATLTVPFGKPKAR